MAKEATRVETIASRERDIVAVTAKLGRAEPAFNQHPTGSDHSWPYLRVRHRAQGAKRAFAAGEVTEIEIVGKA